MHMCCVVVGCEETSRQQVCAAHAMSQHCCTTHLQLQQRPAHHKQGLRRSRSASPHASSRVLFPPHAGSDPDARLPNQFLWPCRQITNRQSAQRMRRKRRNDLQTVLDQVAVLQSEKEGLQATQLRYTIQALAVHVAPFGGWSGELVSGGAEARERV